MADTLSALLQDLSAVQSQLAEVESSVADLRSRAEALLLKLSEPTPSTPILRTLPPKDAK